MPNETHWLNKKSTPRAQTPPLTALKAALGSLGRSDWITSQPDWPGDLIFPGEMLCVFVHNCVVYGCKYHSHQLSRLGEMKKRQRPKIYESWRKQLVKVGWRVIRFYECEVSIDPRLAAEEVIAALASSKHILPDSANFDEHQLARLARADACTRVDDSAWIEMLTTIGLFMGVRDAAKADIETVLIREKGWSPDVFEALWRVAIHHNIITVRHWAVERGRYLLAALKEAGLRKGIEACTREPLTPPLDGHREPYTMDKRKGHHKQPKKATSSASKSSKTTPSGKSSDGTAENTAKTPKSTAPAD